MAELLLIRHFRTPWNAAGRLQGRRDMALDDPLSSEDLVALSRNRKALAGQTFGAVWTSPLLRARQTAALHGFAGAESLEDLAELSFGCWEGQSWADLHAAHPGKWQSAPQDLPLGEDFGVFAARVRSVLMRARALHGPPVLAFGHGAWANCAQALCAGRPAAEMPTFATPNGALLRLCLPI
ncbi:MAG: histidine phosphatase family protein [Paracoccaceae bacterium]